MDSLSVDSCELQPLRNAKEALANRARAAVLLLWCLSSASELQSLKVGRWIRYTLLGALASAACAATWSWWHRIFPQRNEVEVDIAALQSWEEIPGIDEIIRQAQDLEPLEPVTLPNDWNLTECVIDGFQVMTYLGTAVLELYGAIRIEGSRCPNDTPAGCAVPGTPTKCWANGGGWLLVALKNGWLRVFLGRVNRA
eukprot:Skav235928  [mRNA]  locus=scaffold1246:27197:31062:- [translate_table: standard]